MRSYYYFHVSKRDVGLGTRYLEIIRGSSFRCEVFKQKLQDCCIVSQVFGKDGKALRLPNLGDSRVMLARFRPVGEAKPVYVEDDSNMEWREQTHKSNCPFQLGIHSPDLPSHSQL